MRMAIVVLLWACGDGSSLAADSAEPDTGPPPDAPAPSITGFGPGSNSTVCRGAVVGLAGTNLSFGTATISGVPQIVAGSGPDFFIIRVSDATPASTAPIIIETSSGTATSPPLVVLDKHTPEVLSVSPIAPNPNNTVTVIGTDLLDTGLELRLTTNLIVQTSVDVTTNSDTSLMFPMPPNIAAGEYWVWPVQLPIPSGCGESGGTTAKIIVL